MDKNRKTFLDILRILATFAVVIYHVLCSSVSNDPEISAELGTAALSLAGTLKWHVPVFFMITGYLWLNDDKTCTYRNITHNIIRFLLVLLTVGFSYAVMERVFTSGALSARVLFLAFTDVLTGNLWDHMWYLYAAIGIYLFLPAIKPFFKNRQQKEICFFAALLFVFTILFPAVSKTFGCVTPPLASRFLLLLCFMCVWAACWQSFRLRENRGHGSVWTLPCCLPRVSCSTSLGQAACPTC